MQQLQSFLLKCITTRLHCILGFRSTLLLIYVVRSPVIKLPFYLNHIFVLTYLRFLTPTGFIAQYFLLLIPPLSVIRSKHFYYRSNKHCLLDCSTCLSPNYYISNYVDIIIIIDIYRVKIINKCLGYKRLCILYSNGTMLDFLHIHRCSFHMQNVLECLIFKNILV